jgi:hypothetical protein
MRYLFQQCLVEEDFHLCHFSIRDLLRIRIVEEDLPVS